MKQPSTEHIAQHSKTRWQQSHAWGKCRLNKWQSQLWWHYHMPSQNGLQFSWLVHDTRGLLVWLVCSVCLSRDAQEYYGSPSNYGDTTSNFIYIYRVVFKVRLVLFYSIIPFYHLCQGMQQACFWLKWEVPTKFLPNCFIKIMLLVGWWYQIPDTSKHLYKNLILQTVFQTESMNHTTGSLFPHIHNIGKEKIWLVLKYLVWGAQCFTSDLHTTETVEKILPLVGALPAEGNQFPQTVVSAGGGLTCPSEPGTCLQIVHPPDQDSLLLHAWWSPLLPRTEFCNKKQVNNLLYFASLKIDSLTMRYIWDGIPDDSCKLHPEARY